MKIILFKVLTGICVGFVTTSMALAQTQPSLDELLNLDPPVDESGDEPTDSNAEESVTVDEAIGEDVDRAISMSEASDVFVQAVDEMDLVSKKLGKEYDPGIDTQRDAQEIIRKLDQVILAARQKQSSSSSQQQSSARQQDPGSQQQPGQQQQGPAQPSGNMPNQGEFSPGSVGIINPNESTIEELRQEWGNLPPRLRDELLEGLAEPFSPLYRELTEQYYRRLAGDQ